MYRAVFAALAAAFATRAEAKGPAYDLSRLKGERLGRGVVAQRADANAVVVSWRLLREDPKGCGFDVYRNGTKLNAAPLTGATFFRDTQAGCGGAGAVASRLTYSVKPAKGTGAEGAWTLDGHSPIGYLPIRLTPPAAEKTRDGVAHAYRPCDAGAADLDGDGEMEFVLRWDGGGKDNAHAGDTPSTWYEAFKLVPGNGGMVARSLWRIRMGTNVRSGAHYDTFVLYDLDGDGKAEFVVRTADGTVDGRGKVLGDVTVDNRDPDGHVRRAHERLTLFDGATGTARATVDYEPAFVDGSHWSTNRRDTSNRGFRFLSCAAYLDGARASAVFCRGYYDRSTLCAWDWDGTNLTKRWLFDSWSPAWKKDKGYSGQGFHSLRVADVDGDGKDEIVYGAMTIDHDGRPLYTTRLGHGDALHLLQVSPANHGLQVWGCFEGSHGLALWDAATGQILQRVPGDRDTGRCLAGDVDPELPGAELWGPAHEGFYTAAGERLPPPRGRDGPGMSFLVWWRGDKVRSTLDGPWIRNYSFRARRNTVVAELPGGRSVNGTKSTPCLSGDLFGDWREEVLLATDDPGELRLYLSPLPTDVRAVTFLQDPVYRLSLVTQNTGYNQPPHPGFYFGSDGDRAIDTAPVNW